MREFLRLAGILFLISVVAAGALAYTYTLTNPIIEVNRYQKKVQMIGEVLPPFDNQPEKDAVRLPNGRGETIEFYIARKAGRPTGVAFKTSTQGYGSQISLMIGVTRQGEIYGIQILDQNETPGLGSKVTQESFMQQFLKKDLVSSRWEVKKFKGDFDQITAATVSSRAVIRGIKEGLEFYQSHKEEILKSH